MAVDPARAKSLFLEASDLASPAERTAYLDRECGGEAELRARVVALWAALDKAGPFPEPNATSAVESTSHETLPGTATSAAEAAAETRTATAESVENVQTSDLGMRLADEALTREKGWRCRRRPSTRRRRGPNAQQNASRTRSLRAGTRCSKPLARGGWAPSTGRAIAAGQAASRAQADQGRHGLAGRPGPVRRRAPGAGA